MVVALISKYPHYANEPCSREQVKTDSLSYVAPVVYFTGYTNNWHLQH